MTPLKITLDPKMIDNTDEISEYLKGYDLAMAIYDGDYKAHWLLSDIYSSKWIIKTDKTQRVSHPVLGKEYKYVKTLNWKRHLPNGSLLTDSENLHFLRFFQKALFVLIESDCISANLTYRSVSGHFNKLIKFIVWAYREDLELHVNKYGLKRLTQRRLESFFSDLTYGGNFRASGAEKSISSKLSDMFDVNLNTSNLYDLEGELKEKVKIFMRNMGMFTKNNSGIERIDREKFRHFFKLPKEISYLGRFTAFLRQFEDELLAQNKDVLIPLETHFEYPQHTTPLIREVVTKPEVKRTLTSQLSVMVEILKLQPLFPDMLPTPESFNTNKIYNYIDCNCSASELTPWIPINTVLHILNKAIGFILSKGSKLLDCLETVYNQQHALDLLSSHSKGIKYIEQRNKLIQEIITPFTNTLGVTDYYRNKKFDGKKYSYLRKRTTLCDYVNLLKASCFIVIAGTKPIRINELTSLKHDCLYLKEGDGYWLMQNIEKAGVKGELPKNAKPIPNISAKAIQLLQRLNKHASEIFPSKESKFLLYNINYGHSNETASILSSDGVINSLALFCDYIQAPLDNYGRRWYVNIHELRKSFLLLFFWTYKFSSLDACRWIAGHQDTSHVFSYIEANLPGEEMVEVEAEYAAQQLRLFSKNNSISDIKNIEELNNNVCDHFSVKSISEIEENDLKDWLVFALESKKYSINLVEITSNSPIERVAVAVKIVENTNES